MGKVTGEVVSTIHGTGLGSGYFGGCELCSKHVSETFVHQTHRIYVRADGLRYLSPMTGGTYGHRECLVGKFGEAADKSTLPRHGNLTQAPG